MNEKDLFRALGDVDDAWLAAAEAPPQKRKPRLAGGLIAACLCVAVLALTASELSSVFHNGASSDGLPATAANGSPEVLDKESRVTPEAADQTPAHFSADPEAAVPDAQPYALTTEPAATYEACPADFSFTLSWDGNTYDSETGVLTWANGQSDDRPMTEDLRQEAWTLLSGLELPENTRGIVADCGFTTPWDIMAHVARRDYKLPRALLWVLLSLLDLLARLLRSLPLPPSDPLDQSPPEDLEVP